MESVGQTNGRFTIVDNPPCLPGSCATCGGSTKESYLDTSLYFEFHGGLFFCNECIEAMATLYGWITPEKAIKYQTQIEFLETQLFELQRKNAGLEQAVDGLRFGGYSSFDTQRSVYLSSENSEQSASGAEGELGTGEGETSQQSNDEGVGELRSTSVDDEESEYQFDF